VTRRVAIIVCEKKRGILKERMVPVPEEIVTIKEWDTNPKKIQKRVRDAAKRLAALTGNQDYLEIHPHTFRHWYATEVYSKTQDIMLVKELLGHEKLEDVTIYVHIVRMQNSKKEAIKVDISDVERVLELIKAGWKVAIQTNEFVIFEKPTFP
jgi:integrase